MAAYQSYAKPPPPSHVAADTAVRQATSVQPSRRPTCFCAIQSHRLAAAVPSCLRAAPVPHCRHVVHLCLLAGNRTSDGELDENDHLVSWNEPTIHAYSSDDLAEKKIDHRW